MALTVALMLGGCSGAGVSPGVARNQALQSLAAEHLTTVQLLRSWLTVMYPAGVGQTGQWHIDVVQVDEDTWRCYGTDSLGQPLDFYSNADGSGYGYWYTAPGVRVDGTWTPCVWLSARVVQQDVQYQYPDLHLSYRVTCDYAPPGGNGFAATRQEGTAALVGGQQLAFCWANNAVDCDQLHLELPAARLMVDLQVPVTQVYNEGWRPAPGQPATGTMQGPDGGASLALTGTDCDWQHWALTAADGTTGSFDLGAGMSGSGQISRGGSLQAALNWTDTLTGRLDMLGLGQVELTPAAAARDLAIEKWLHSVAGLGPGAIM